MLVEQQREPQAEHELGHARDYRVKKRIEHGQAEYAVGHQELVVLDADPFANATYLGIREAQPDPETQRVSQEEKQQRSRGQHEQQPEDVAVVEEAGSSAHGKAVRIVNVVNTVSA